MRCSRRFGSCRSKRKEAEALITVLREECNVAWRVLEAVREVLEERLVS
jgi:hypothetical protein